MPVLVAAPGMTMGEIAAASTAKFELPRPDDERGRIQPEDPHIVDIRRPDHTIRTPPGDYTVGEDPSVLRLQHDADAGRTWIAASGAVAPQHRFLAR